MLSVLLFTALFYCAMGTCTVAMAQALGQFPAGEKLRPRDESSSDESGDLRVKSFYLLDSSRNPVFIGDMAWEEYDELKSGTNATSKLFAYKSLSITGQAMENRADLKVSLDLSISPTGGKLISIPLQMSNFHVRQPATFAPRVETPDADDEQQATEDEFFLELAPDGKGYVLNARSEGGCELNVTMGLSARVESGATESLDFRLPDVPSRVEISVARSDLVGEIVGRGDEVLETLSQKKNQTLFRIESGGGRFMLRWRQRDRPTETPLLEVDGLVTMRLNSPQDQAIQNSQMEIRNLRGSVSTFELLLPVGAKLLEDPRLVRTNQFVELTNERETAGGTQLTVKIPDEEVGQAIDLNVDIQLAQENTAANSPLAFRVPTIVGAWRQEGEIQIAISNDYRLRWTEHEYVQGITDAVDGETKTVRKYFFSYDNGAFVLPLRMTAAKRQLRASSEIELRFHESDLELKMFVRFNGQSAGNQGLRMDLAGWEYRAVANLETDESLPWERNGDMLDVILQNNGTDAPLPIVLEARRAVDPESKTIDLRLPRIVKTDDNLLVQKSELAIQSPGRSSVVVDLTKSDGLERRLPSDEDSSARSGLLDPNRFRLVPPEESARMVASVVPRPPRITLASNATCTLTDQQIETIVNWTLTSQADLEGRLRVAIPDAVLSSPDQSQEKPDQSQEKPDQSQEKPSRSQDDLERAPSDATESADVVAQSSDLADALSQWTVYVDDQVAVLNPIDLSADADSTSRLFELVSPTLSEGTFEIRWRNVTPASIADDPFGRAQTTQAIPIPRPIVDDITIRGDVQLSLNGNETHELIVAESSAQSLLTLQSLPREPLDIAIVAKKTRNQQELTIRKAVVRTAFGELSRHEQVLVQTQGGNSLTVDLPSGDTVARIQVFVDGENGSYERDEGQLHIALPDDKLTHTVDLRIWVEDETPAVLEKVGPILALPFGVQRTYWQVLTPGDKHVTWADPAMGQEMTWSFESWRLLRRPLQNDAALANWVGGSQPAPMPEGNRYLFDGADSRAFRVRVASRTVLWMWVSGIMIAASVMLTYVPQTRHPITAVVAALAFTGLLIVAPDAAVLTGQLAMISVILVCVMLAVRSLMQPQPARVLTSTRPAAVSEGSTRSLAPTSAGDAEREEPRVPKSRDDRSESTDAAETPTASVPTPAKNAEGDLAPNLAAPTRGSSVQSTGSRHGSTTRGPAPGEPTPGELAP